MKRILAFSLVSVLIIACFAGCGPRAEPENTAAVSESSAPTPEPTGEPIGTPTAEPTPTPTPTPAPTSYAYKDGVVNVILEPSLALGDYVASFTDGLASVSGADGKYGCIDKYGNEVIPCVYDNDLYFSDGLAPAGKDGMYGFIDVNGNTVVPFEYTGYREFSEGLAFVTKDKGESRKWGCIDAEGNEVIPFVYDGERTGFSRFREGLMQVRQGGDTGYIDREGKLVIPYSFTMSLNFSEGFAWTTAGYIDKSGDIVIWHEYGDDMASGFSGGLALVRDNEKYGFIDTSGDLAIPVMYDEASSFSEGLAYAELDGRKFFMDTEGHEVFQCDYDGVPYQGFTYGLAVVQKDGKSGMIDTDGNLAVPMVYDSIGYYSEPLVWMEVDGKRGVLEIVPNDAGQAGASTPTASSETEKPVETPAPEAGTADIGKGVTVTYTVAGENAAAEITECPAYGERNTPYPYVRGRLTRGVPADYELITVIQVGGKYYGKKPRNDSPNAVIAEDRSFQVQFASADGVGSDWNAEQILIFVIPAGYEDGIAPNAGAGYTVPAGQVDALKENSAAVIQIDRAP